MNLRVNILAGSLAVALSLPCRADKPPKLPDATPEGVQAVVMRKAETAKRAKVAKSELTGGVVTVTYEDGTVVSQPLKRVTMDARTVGGIDVSIARTRLERAAYTAAKLAPDASAAEKVAVLDALAAECGKGGKLGQTLAAAAAAALAGMAAGRATKKDGAA